MRLGAWIARRIQYSAHMRDLLRFLPVVCAFLGLAVAELDARPRTFVAGQGVRMKVDVPPGYSFKTETNPEGLTQVVLENPVWRIVVIAIISPEYTAETTTEEWQRNLVVSNSADYLAQSKEQDYRFRALNPAQGSGVYCVFTDPDVKPVDQLKPEEFNHVVVGTKVIRGGVMLFRILCNDMSTPEYQEAFNLFVTGFDEA